MPAIYKNGKNYGGGTTVDSALSSTSTNPVQNKVVKQALDELILNFANYYNKTEVDNIVNTIKNSRFEAVSTLPTTDIKTNVIYLVPKSPTQTNNAKDEYINLDGTSSGWEKIGDTEIDLSGYVTTTALNTALSDYTTTTDLTALLNNKVDKVTGKGLSTNDYTNVEKQKNADNASAISDIQEDISQSLTATGNPLTIESSESNLVECVAEVEPVQDLHGYDHPWVGGAGKNKVDYLSCVGIGARDGTDSVYASGTTSISGKNLNINYAYENNGGILKGIKGVPVNFGEYVTISFDVVSLTGSSFFTVGIGDYNGGGTNNVRDNVAPTNNKVSVTLDAKSNYTKVGVFIQPVNANSSAVITNVQLELGQTATSYAPYSNISPIIGQTEVVIEDVGKNLWDEGLLEIGGISGDSHNKDNSTTWVRGTKAIFLSSGTYNLSSLNFIGRISNVYEWSAEVIRGDNFVRKIIEHVLPCSFTLAESAYISFEISVRRTVTLDDLTNSNVQLELGSTATDFEPYKGKTYTIQLGDTIYGGELDAITGKMRVDRGMNIVDDSWTYSTYGGKNYLNKAINHKVTIEPISSMCEFGGVGSASIFTDGKFYSNGSIDIYINDSRYPSKQAMLNIYGGCQVVYELATPYTIQLTPQQIRLLKGTNHLSCNTGDLSIKYYPDNVLGQLKGDIESEYDERVETLEEKVDNAMQKGVDYVTAGQLAGSTLGAKATAEGRGTVASKENSHAEGSFTTASGFSSHAEGGDTLTSGSYSHAEGTDTSARGDSSHAEGANTLASGNNSHAEGYYTTASGVYSHAEGDRTSAKGNYSHAEGNSTTASGETSHAEGIYTIASNYASHAEGANTSAKGSYSHAEGENTVASGTDSHAEGGYTTASNYASHAGGHYNVAMTPGGNPYNTTGTAFVIGNGVHTSALGNAFSVQYNGVVKAASTITASTTADYAEFFEWSDENPNNEDRVGYFVTIDENEPTKIRIANSNDDYILGIVSGTPFVLGNGDCDVWNGMVMKDEFGRIIYEPAQKYEINPETGEEEPVYDEDGNPVYEGTKPVYNPEYDPTIPYISRFDRPEWSPVGMLGVLHVRDDGSCTINGYCTVGENGIATKTDSFTQTSYKVIARINSNIIKVIFR